MREGYRGSSEPIPAMKTVHPAGVISLMKESRIEADLRIAKSLSAESGKSLPPAWEHIEVLVRHRKWQKEAIQRVRAVLADWRAKDDLADEIGEGGWAPPLGPLAEEIEAALLHDDSEKADG